DDINLAEQINVAPSSTAVLITRGPRGYGLIDVTEDAGELVLTYESPTGPVDSDPIPLPPGTPGPPGTTTVDGLTDATSVGKAVAKAADPAEARAVIGALSKTVADGAYAPLAQAVPTGGTTGQVLTKTAGGFAFAAPTGGGGGGLTVTDNGSTITLDVVAGSTTTLTDNGSTVTITS
ncbi:MAG: hypothetical protein INR66_18270, partial [Gordonia polyisoprenivorans]|nr:hypothetical protein [Gordonia polyisoprenivorans]